MSKTDYLCVGGPGPDLKQDQISRNVNEYKYLRSYFTKDGKDDQDIWTQNTIW